ncbi:carbohydate-binding domain-containing protein [Aestuariibacter sp. AA17]|uniref:beta-N-acetylhexosaminidase n=1 Tax=Fluctibacter corallii TaxID=2984329 RepID=A0ABT3A582_9ALTE|nr:family 20 glycosylhydrolase [Aestuariibacter sp. AA17]MCV2883757.1 carbohydate-binding domain-containing protein [Aestuariibacter sp. AA17]
MWLRCKTGGVLRCWQRRYPWLLGCAFLMMQSVLPVSASVRNDLPITQTRLKQLADELQITYQVISNTAQRQCDTPIGGGTCFVAELTLTNGSTALPSDTSAYFSHISPIQHATNPNFQITHVKGDLHRLQLVNGLKAGETQKTELLAPFWHAARSDVMPNYYLVSEGLHPEIILSTQRVKQEGTGLFAAAHAGHWDTPQQFRRNTQDNLPLATPEYRFEQRENATHTAINDSPRHRLIPGVKSLRDSQQWINTKGIEFAPDVQTRFSLSIQALRVYGLKDTPDSLPVTIRTHLSNASSDTTHHPEGYHLRIVPSGVLIEASTLTGAKYALMTLGQLWDDQKKRLPVVEIHDEPHFAFRGMHVDLARHFPGKASLHNLITQMHLTKLNKLHLHLSDDEGWRLEINGLPELTEIGAYRCHDVTERRCLLPQLGSGPYKSALGNGYLTAADYIELVKYANALGIEVIPSFDMPGHARAAIVSMEARYNKLLPNNPQQANAYRLIDPKDTTEYLSIQFYNDNTINPCIEGTYRFVEHVIDTVIDYHRQADVPLTTFHLGADETAGAWKASPACAMKNISAENGLGYFVAKVVKLGQQKGLTMAGWSDGIEESLTQIKPNGVQANIWKTLYWGAEQSIEEFAKAHVPAVYSFPDVLYFDFPYANHPYEPGYYWGSKHTDTRKVFEFMPLRLSAHRHLWQDRMGNQYTNSVQTQHAPLGIQGQLWTEVTPNQAALEYMLYPRLYALADRAWHIPDWQRIDDVSSQTFASMREHDWHTFQMTLATKMLPSLIQQQINFRLPPPAATLRKGKLHMLAGLPNLLLEYSEDGKRWHLYDEPVAVAYTPYVRSRWPNTHHVSMVLSLKK